MSPKVGVARSGGSRSCAPRSAAWPATATRPHAETVAREARVSQGILHYYFADKRAILVAALAA